MEDLLQDYLTGLKVTNYLRNSTISTKILINSIINIQKQVIKENTTTWEIT